MPATLFYTGKFISVINSKLFCLKCLCAIFWECNEDISVNILKSANLTHYVELIYTYHTTTYLYLHTLGGRTLLLFYTLEGTYTPLLYTLGGSFRPVCGTPHECMLFTPFLTVYSCNTYYIMPLVCRSLLGHPNQEVYRELVGSAILTT